MDPLDLISPDPGPELSMGMDELLLGRDWEWYRIDPSTAGDRIVCKPDTLRTLAGRMSQDVLAPLEAALGALPAFPAGAAGNWDVAAGYEAALLRGDDATRQTLQLVIQQVQQVIDNVNGTADAFENGDLQAVASTPKSS
ncbi:hypothetical protein [Streptosporangium sp. KLBMP 9127]|nr:hypothetical protein [Streptosporangium sp. KLBMP 9127]